DYLVSRLNKKGYRVVSPRGDRERSAIVTCTHREHTPGSLYHRLRERNIITAHRVGRLRIAPHLYNTRDEVDQLIDALPDEAGAEDSYNRVISLHCRALL